MSTVFRLVKDHRTSSGMAFQYKSFVDRGVYVGFESRLVEMTRYRLSADPKVSREALIPNWSGEESGKTNDLVMVFRDLPKWCALKGRDNTLFERVCSGKGEIDGHLDPLTIRELRLQTDLDEGDDFEKGHARYEANIARADVQNAYLEILAMFGRNYGMHSGDGRLKNVNREVLLRLSDTEPHEMLKLIRIIVGTVVRGSSLTRERLNARLENLSALAAPMCSLVTLDPKGDVGFLSRQFTILDRLREEIEAFADDQPDEIQRAGRLIAFTLRSFSQYALNHAGAIRDALLEEHYYLDDSAYDTQVDLIKQERTRIAYAMDGWANHASRWLNVAPHETEGRLSVIAYILRQMPAPPKEVEDEVPVFQGGISLMAMRSRSVKEMHSWMDDSLDDELFRRVMQGRGELPTDQVGGGGSKAAGIAQTALRGS